MWCEDAPCWYCEKIGLRNKMIHGSTFLAEQRSKSVEPDAGMAAKKEKKELVYRPHHDKEGYFITSDNERVKICDCLEKECQGKASHLLF